MGGFGQLDSEVKSLLRGASQRALVVLPKSLAHAACSDTDHHRAQSEPDRRMSAICTRGNVQMKHYPIHGSLEASAALGMIGLGPFRPGLNTHEQIVETMESKAKQCTVEEPEELNKENRQAGMPADTHQSFLRAPHVCRPTDSCKTGCTQN